MILQYLKVQTVRIYRDLHLKLFSDDYFYFVDIFSWIVFMMSDSNDRMIFIVRSKKKAKKYNINLSKKKLSGMKLGNLKLDIVW